MPPDSPKCFKCSRGRGHCPQLRTTLLEFIKLYLCSVVLHLIAIPWVTYTIHLTAYAHTHKKHLYSCTNTYMKKLRLNEIKRLGQGLELQPNITAHWWRETRKGKPLITHCDPLTNKNFTLLAHKPTSSTTQERINNLEKLQEWKAADSMDSEFYSKAPSQNMYLINFLGQNWPLDYIHLSCSYHILPLLNCPRQTSSYVSN